MKQTNERLCALAQKGDAAALDSLIDNNKSFIGKVANDLFRSMNLAQAVLSPIRCKTLLDGGRRRTKNLYGVFKRTVPAGQVRQ